MKKTDAFIKEVEKKFMCPEKFAYEIESIVSKNPKSNYINAIIEFCEDNSIEPELIAKIIPKTLKAKIKNDATKLNFLKKTTSAKLPI